MTYRRLIEEAGLDWTRASVVRTGGPERVLYDDSPDPNFKPRPVGFTADLREPDPLLWDGDNA